MLAPHRGVIVRTMIGEVQSAGRWFEGRFDELAQLPAVPDS
jgi:hypothetical protein